MGYNISRDSYGSWSGLGDGTWESRHLVNPGIAQKNGAESWGCRTTVSVGRCSSSTSGNQSAVRTGGSQVSQSAVEWRSAVGSRQSVSSQRRGQRRRRRRRTTTAELPAHCRICGAGTMHEFYLGGGAACTLQDMRHCRQQRRPQRQQTRRRRWRRQTRRAGCSGVPCVVAWCRQTLGHWQWAQLPSLLPPSPSLTYNNQADEGGGEQRRRRCQRRRLISGQAQRQQRRQR